MKTNYFNRVNAALASALIVRLPFQMLPVSEGESAPEDIEVADIARPCVRLVGVGETGTGKTIGLEGANRYELSGSAIIVHLAPARVAGEMRVIVSGSYGQVRLNANVAIVAGGSTSTELDLQPYIFDAIAASGGADYKTDVYMDGSGRVIVERTEDGGTLVLDEHENPILKRHADGTTEVYDAYQSGRVAVSANGGVTINSGDGEHFVVIGSAAVGATTDTEVGTNALVNGYGCKATGTNSHAEGAATVASGVSSHAEGSSDQTNTCTASGEASHAEGIGCVASGKCAHAEGWHCTASNEQSHAEGYSCTASGVESHAEGAQTKAIYHYTHSEGYNSSAGGQAAHAEGSYAQASGNSSHAEGERTVSSGLSSHAEGYYTKSKAGYSHAQGIYNNDAEMTEQGAFAHGCGTSSADRRNAFLIEGSEVYVYGVGGYDGTNHTEAQSLRQVLSAINLKLVNVPTA